MLKRRVFISCAALGGFAIGARVALLWQRTRPRTRYKLACTPRHDNIVRTRNVSECSVLALCLVTNIKTIAEFRNVGDAAWAGMHMP